ncbi:MAG: hypothetical protein EA349_04865 [Halomonadaceae bacterium]|nr:MAG: hypothetical protein EA349_04865 [Halomonadaceae bacterium]
MSTQLPVSIAAPASAGEILPAPVAATEKDHRIQWWLGFSDLGGNTLTQGALGIERMHLSIADEAFNILERIPVTRPVSEQVRVLHHGISTLCYRGVAGVGQILSRKLGKDKE